MDIFSYSTHPARGILTRLFEFRKSVSLTKLISIANDDSGKLYIFSPSLHQDLYQKIIKCFINSIPIKLIQNIIKEEDLDLLIEGTVNHKNFGKSETEIET